MESKKDTIKINRCETVVFSSFKHLPADLWYILFFDWLTDVRDIVSMDTALCSTHIRPPWLSLFRKKSFRKIMFSPTSLSTNSSALNWLRTREVYSVQQLIGVDLDCLQSLSNMFGSHPADLPNEWKRQLHGLTISIAGSQILSTSTSFSSILDFASSCTELHGFGLYCDSYRGQEQVPINVVELILERSPIRFLQLNLTESVQLPLLTSLFRDQHERISQLRTLSLHLQFTGPVLANTQLTHSLDVVRLLQSLPHLDTLDLFGVLLSTDTSLGNPSTWSERKDLHSIQHLQLGLQLIDNDDITNHTIYNRSLTCYLLYKCINAITVAVSDHQAFQQAKYHAKKAEEYLRNPTASMYSTSSFERRHKHLRQVMLVNISSCRYFRCVPVATGSKEFTHGQEIADLAKHPMFLDSLSSDKPGSSVAKADRIDSKSATNSTYDLSSSLTSSSSALFRMLRVFSGTPLLPPTYIDRISLSVYYVTETTQIPYIISAKSPDDEFDESRISFPKGAMSNGHHLGRLLRSTMNTLQVLTIDDSNFTLSSVLTLIQCLPDSTTTLRINATNRDDEARSTLLQDTSLIQSSLYRINSSLESLQLHFTGHKVTAAFITHLAILMGKLCPSLKVLGLQNIPMDADDSYVESLLWYLPQLTCLSLFSSGIMSGVSASSTTYAVSNTANSAPFGLTIPSGHLDKSSASSHDGQTETFAIPKFTQEASDDLSCDYCMPWHGKVSRLMELELHGTFTHFVPSTSTPTSTPSPTQLNTNETSLSLIRLLHSHCPELRSVVWSQTRLTSRHLALWLTKGMFPNLQVLQFPQVLRFQTVQLLREDEVLLRKNLFRSSELSSLLVQTTSTFGATTSAAFSTPLWTESATVQFLHLLQYHKRLEVLSLDGIALDDRLFSRLLVKTRSHLKQLSIHDPIDSLQLSPPPESSKRPGALGEAPPGFGRPLNYKSNSNISIVVEKSDSDEAVTNDKADKPDVSADGTQEPSTPVPATEDESDVPYIDINLLQSHVLGQCTCENLSLRSSVKVGTDATTRVVLEELNLSNVKYLSQRGLEVLLSSLASMDHISDKETHISAKSLQSLNISDCPQILVPDAVILQARFPSCHIQILS